MVRILNVFIRVVFIVCLLLQISCCSVAKIAESTQGTDTDSISKGVSREAVEQILGAPGKEWTTLSNIRYCLYTYDTGVPMGPALVASLWHLFADLGSGGVWELNMLEPGYARALSIEDSREYAIVAIAYDENNMVIKVHENIKSYDELPPGSIDKDLLITPND